jgi:hypothetical protein
LISFIVLKWSIRDTRNTKRLSDVKSLFLKIETESLRWTDYSKIMNTEEKTPTSLTINWKDWIEWFQNIENPINRDVLRENWESFKDPLNNHPYPFAYVIWDSNEIWYDFIQLAYVEEWTWRTTKLVWNYNKILPWDSPSLFTKEWMNWVNIPEDYIADGWEPIYSNSQSDSQTSYVSPKEVYWDEDEDAITACLDNKKKS